MDIELEKKVQELLDKIKNYTEETMDFQEMDPIVKMMIVALLNEIQKIQDELDNIGEKITDKFCTDFIPRQEVEAMPSIAVVAPEFRKNKRTETIEINTNILFSLKTPEFKYGINFIPLIKGILYPYNEIYSLTQNRLSSNSKEFKILMENSNILWLGINTDAEVESLKGLSIFIEGVNYVHPEHIYVINEKEEELSFSMMSNLEDLEMLEPFDSQQVSNNILPIITYWKKIIQNRQEGSIIYITDEKKDRDVFKKKAFPHIFQNWLESEVLDFFSNNTIWLKIEYPENYIIPDSCKIIINSIPIVNINVENITLTQTTPIAKLQKQENSFFIQTLETSNDQQKLGFTSNEEDIIIKDYDVRCYNNGDLYRDIRNLYNHFVEDYHAFIEFNNIKDGKDIKQLKELINKIGKSAGTQNSKYKFDSGTYAMKNIKNNSTSSSVKVSYITTQGALGNKLKRSKIENNEVKLECKRIPFLNPDIPIIIDASGGRDKASADERYEHLRYFTLTNDRLFTKMDIEAFIRKELIELYGKEEFKRIKTKISIEGIGTENELKRGLYIDISFKDEKNFKRAEIENLAIILKQKIINKSCISMPINISIYNLE